MAPTTTCIDRNSPELIVISGPTASGKTAGAIKLAQELHTVVVSADSRQFYKEMKIGTAVPSTEEMTAVPHFFIGNKSVTEKYDVSRYETDVLKLLSQLFQKYNQVILCGGSGLYIDAVVKGIDDLPDPDTEIRAELKRLCAEEGIETLRAKLKIIDPEYYDVVDLANPIRLIRALEIYYVTGKKFSQLRSGTNKKRDFNIVKYALQLPREQLYERINSRVDLMMQAGLLDEVKSLIPYRHYPALNTVGYKELFSYLDGEISLDTAVEKIKTDTRRYAKRQITWISRDNGYKMIAPDASFVENVLSL